MYHLNYKLIEKLPSILRIPKKEIRQKMQRVQYPTFPEMDSRRDILRVAGKDMQSVPCKPVSSLHHTGGESCHHGQGNGYVISEDRWAPVEWRNEEILSLFRREGDNGHPEDTGVVHARICIQPDIRPLGEITVRHQNEGPAEHAQHIPA